MQLLIQGYRRLLTHPRYGLWVLLATLVYLISPLDLSPDVIPILGQIDDVALIVLMASAATQWLSQQFLRDQEPESAGSADEDAYSVQQTIDIDAVEVDPSSSSRL